MSSRRRKKTKPAEQTPKKKGWHQRFLNWGSVGVMAVGGLLALGAQKTVGTIVEKWFDGDLIVEPVYLNGTGPDGEICKATFQFVNNTSETVLVNEFHFRTEASGKAKSGGALHHLRDFIPERGQDGLMLPNLAPNESRTRSVYRKLTLKPGEACDIDLMLYPPMMKNAATVGEYKVTPTVETSVGDYELESVGITVGQTIFDTPNRRPSTLYLENEDGTFDTIDSGL